MENCTRSTLIVMASLEVPLLKRMKYTFHSKSILMVCHYFVFKVCSLACVSYNKWDSPKLQVNHFARYLLIQQGCLWGNWLPVNVGVKVAKIRKCLLLLCCLCVCVAKIQVTFTSSSAGKIRWQPALSDIHDTNISACFCKNKQIKTTVINNKRCQHQFW